MPKIISGRSVIFTIQLLFVCAIAGCANAPKPASIATTQPIAANTVTEPSSQNPVAYRPPTTEQITKVLERIRDRLDAASAPRFVDAATKQEVTDISKPLPGLTIDAGPDGKFKPVTYAMGVVHTGMLEAADATADPRFSQYTAKWFQFFADNLPALSAWPKRTLQPLPPVQPGTNQQSAANADQPASAAPTTETNRRKALTRVENPFRPMLAPASLDDCGSMTSAMIQARLAGVGPDLKPVIDRAVQFVSQAQFRLSDGTLARHRPVRDSVWADDMYMGVSLLAQAGKMTGDPKYYDDAAQQVLGIGRRLFVPNEKLFTHGWNTVNPDDHPTYFWGRANGWCMMAMAELLTVLPENHPDRPAILKQFRTLAQGIASAQAGDGLWNQMLNRPDSYTETSCSAMFVFAFARGINRGWLDYATYGPVAEVGWNGLAARVDPQGRLSGVCVGTTYANDYFYYYHRPATDDVHGYGPMLLAGAEMIRLLNNPRFLSLKGAASTGQIQLIARPSSTGHSKTRNDTEGYDATTPTNAPTTQNP